MSSGSDHSRNGEPRSRSIWLPMLVGGILCALVFILWLTLYEHEQSHIQYSITAEAEYLAKHVEIDLLRNRIPDIQHLAQIWEIQAGLTQQEFIDITGTDSYNFPGLLALARTDKDLDVKWLTPGDIDKQSLNIPANLEQQKNVLKTQTKNLWKTGMDIMPDHNHFLLYCPLYSKAQFDGFLLEVFHIRTWLDHVFRISRYKHSGDDFRVAVFFDDIQVYRQPGWDTLPQLRFEGLASMEFLDHNLSLSVRPTPAYLEKNHNMLPEFTLVAGILFSLLVAFVIYLQQKSFSEARKAQSAKAALEIEIHEHKKTADQLQLTLARIEMATKAGGIGVWLWNLDNNTLNWNERMYEIFGLPSDIPLTHEIWRQAVHPDDLFRTEELLRKAVEGKAVYHNELRIITGIGHIRYISSAARVERDQNGKPLRVSGICLDMTELKNAEISLRHNSEMQKILTDIASQYINIPLSELPYTIPNALKKIAKFLQADYAQILHYDFELKTALTSTAWRRENLKTPFKDIPLSLHQEWLENHNKGLPRQIPDVTSLPDGEFKNFLESNGMKSIISIPLMQKNKLRGCICFSSITDVRHYTEDEIGLMLAFAQIIISIDLRFNAEMEQRKSEEKVRLLLDSTAEGIYGVDPDGNCTLANQACLKLLGYTDMDNLLNKNMHELIHHSHADGTPMPSETCRILLAFQEEKGCHVEDEVFWRADGTPFPVEYWSHPQMHNGEVTGTVITFVDITERKHIQDELRKSEANFRDFFESMSDMVFVAGNDARIMFTNKTAQRKLGYTADELDGRNMLNLHPPENRQEAEEICAAIFRGETQQCPLPLATHKGVSIPVETNARAGRWNGEDCIFLISKDVSAEQETQQRLERLFRNNPAPMVLATFPDTRIYDANNAFEKVLGYARHQVIGRTAGEIKLFADELRMKKAIGHLRTDKRLVDFELPIRRKDGVILHGLFSGELVKTQGHQYIIMVMIDITERKKAEEALAVERRRLSDILEGTNVGTWEWNVQTGETFFNERWAQILGYTLAELSPVSIDTWTKFIHPDDLSTAKELLEKHFSRQLPYYECEMRMRHKEGHWIWVLDRGKVATWTGDGKPLLISGTHQDITARKLNEEHIRHLATHDMLTGLPSLRLAKDRLSMAKSQARRQKNIVAIMFIDLDGFKTVNDTLGHEAGDMVLTEVAQRLLGCVRETDTAARIGGDEFLVIATGLNSAENAGFIAQKIIEQLSQPINIKKVQAKIGASIGIALYPEHGDDMEGLIKQADMAMYKIKQKGKNAFGFANPTKPAPPV